VKSPVHEYQELRRTFAMHGEKQQLQIIESLASEDSLQVSTLVSMWQAESMPSILRWVARALCGVRSAEASACVVEALAHPNMSVRLHAVSGIQKAQRQDMLAFVRPLVKDASGAVRLRTLSALVAMHAEDLEPLLKAALDDPKNYVRSFAHSALSVASLQPMQYHAPR
jgi:HEAT repeat protein